MTLTDYLREHRLTHAEFGIRIGVTQAAVTRYANGRRMPSLRKLVEIERVTADAVKPIDFLSGEAANVSALGSEDAA